MNTRQLTIAALGFGACTAGLFFVFEHQPETGTAAAPATALAPPRGTLAGGAHDALAAATNSPFGLGPPVVADAGARIAARRQNMADRRYATPAEYDTMNAKQLQALAARGDVFAMMQLGERYLFEADTLANDPEYDKKADYQRMGKQYLADAAAAGQIRAAGMLSAQYAQEQNLVEAYAWQLLAAKAQDSNDARNNHAAEILAQLSEQQKIEAYMKFAEHWQRSQQQLQSKAQR